MKEPIQIEKEICDLKIRGYEDYQTFKIILTSNDLTSSFIEGYAIEEEENIYFLEENFEKKLQSCGINPDCVIDALENNEERLFLNEKNDGDDNYQKVHENHSHTISEYEIFNKFMDVYKKRVTPVPGEKVERILELGFSVGCFFQELNSLKEMQKNFYVTPMDRIREPVELFDIFLKRFEDKTSEAIDVFLRHIENLKI